MANKIHLHDNFEVNFQLKGFNSILIGIYIFLAAYVYKYVLDSYLIDDNPLALLSPQLIEILFISVAFFVTLLSSLALFFSGKRKAKRFQFKLWNGKTKTAFLKYLLGIFIISISVLTLKNYGNINFITPAFLFLYGLLLLILKNKGSKSLYILISLSMLLGILCILIPTYWYSSLTIVAIAHITYGVVVK
ncbi:MAG: hypothetical protein ABF263_07470 [Polaribacter sp.]|uniref:hypothetical protein n=1 Tax=Polaribacter sp. TaxID=1920175 RepID=UPI00321D3B54